MQAINATTAAAETKTKRIDILLNAAASAR
jgi:hypothetical protein